MAAAKLEILSQVEPAVRDRYAAAAQAVEPALCCPVQYNADYLAMLPAEIIERDYGCGDPTPYVRPGDVVLDLGSGGGKVCYIAAQVAGPNGRVIGVDCNQEMLALARRHQTEFAERLGYANLEFRCGLIQDLQLNLDLLAAELVRRPVVDQASWLELRALEDRLRREQPLIASGSVDCVVSNCVLNLVRRQDRVQLFSEVFRVLKPGGRAAISDIVADADVPEHLQQNPELWSGCISGAFREDRFLAAFEQAGFHGIRLAKRESQPWRVVEGIAFRSVTVTAYKATVSSGENEPAQELIYLGPFKEVLDEAGNRFTRGQGVAVDGRTQQILLHEPFADSFAMRKPVGDAKSAQETCCDGCL